MKNYSSKIKNIGSQEIWVTETTDYPTNLFRTIPLFMITFIGFLYFCFESSPSMTLDWLIISFIISGIMGLMVISFIGMIGLLSYNIPSWRVYILDDDKSGIIFKKISTEIDQKAICEAAQSLESKAREFESQKLEIQRLASNCK